MESPVNSDFDSDALSYEIVRLEDIITEAIIEHYKPEAANNAFNRLSIGYMTGFVQLTH